MIVLVIYEGLEVGGKLVEQLLGVVGYREMISESQMIVLVVYESLEVGGKLVEQLLQVVGCQMMV